MGDIKKPRKKYITPSHPWRKVRIEEEKKLCKEYGLKNKKEIWKHRAMLSSILSQAKRLIALRSKQAEKEKQQMFSRLARLGLLKSGGQIDDVLSLQIKDILERRLQTLVYRKGLARSMKQARQFITHEHIMVEDKKIKSPAYLVNLQEENSISFVNTSPLANPEHPERVVVVQQEAKEEKEEKSEVESKDKKDEKKEQRKKEKKDSKAEKKDVKNKEKKDAKEIQKDKKEKVSKK